MGQPLPLFSFIFGLFKQTILFLQQIIVKDVHPVNSAGLEPQRFVHESSPES